MRTGLLALSLLVLGADEDAAPRLLSKPTIRYPRQAQDLHVAGDAVFVAGVDQKGKVTRVEVRAVPLRGVGFEEAVQAGVKRWRFEPAVVQGQPRAGEYVGRVTFGLRADDEHAIGEIVTRFVQAWNGTDAAGLAATFEPDEGQVRTGVGPAAKGHQAIEAWAAARFATARPLLATKWAGLVFYAPERATARVPVDGLDRDVYVKLTSKQGGWFVHSLEDPLLVGQGALAVAPRRVGEGGIVTPRRVGQAPYPLLPTEERAQGTVLLECVVTAEGNVTDVRAVSGPLWLRGPAVTSVQGWRYEPTIVDGQPVPVAMTVSISFRH